MTDFPVFIFFCLIFVTTFDQSSELLCYQCEPIAEECEVIDASITTCGDNATSRCSKQVEINSPDAAQAIRKCVTLDRPEFVNCSARRLCFTCEEDLCNGHSAVASSTTSKLDSPPSAIYLWSSLTTAIFVKVYL